MTSEDLEYIHKDATYKKFKLAVQKIQNTINVEEIINECESLHYSRLSTKIKDSKGQFSPQMMIDANAIDLSNRARLAYLGANLQLRASKLESAIDAIENYIQSKYSEEYELKTVDAKRRFVRHVIKHQYKYYKDLKAALEFIYALIKDIDQANYNLKNMIDCMKILSEKKI